MKWNLYEAGTLFDTVEATAKTIEGMLENALGSGSYDNDETIYVDGWAVPIRRGKEDADGRVYATARIDPAAPKCVRGMGNSHEWRQTDLRGSGGGVLITETCEVCGCVKVTNTWGQRRDTGEQGLEVISYE